MKCTEPAQKHAGKKFLSRALEVASPYISHFLFLVPTKPCRGPTDEGNSLLTSACDSGSKIAATFDDRHAEANFSEFGSKFQVEEPLFLKLSEIAFENSIGQVKGSSCAKKTTCRHNRHTIHKIRFPLALYSRPCRGANSAPIAVF